LNMSDFKGFALSETWWRGIILVLSGAVLIITVWCLTHGITTIFMHLYYFPIVLLAYRYRWKGFGIATLLAILYLAIVILFDTGQLDVISGAFYRFLVFVGIAAVIAYLSERLVCTQDLLKESHQFQESVIANANVWISVLSLNGTILVWNDAAEAISGYKKASVLGKNTLWKQLYPDRDYRKKITSEIQRIIMRDTILENFETTIHCADGAKKVVVWNTRGLRDESGSITSYIAIGRDITGQREAESRAGVSSHFLATMIDTLPVAIFFKDAYGKYIGCNPLFEEYIGIKKSDLLGKTVYDISPKDLADQYTAADREVMDNPAPQRYETQVQYADGSRHDVIFYKAPYFNADGSVGGLIGTFLDISERKIAEKELRESEEKYRTLFESMSEGFAYCRMIYDTDDLPADFIYLTVNPAFDRIIGVPTVTGKPVTEVFPGIRDEFPELFETYGRVARRAVPESFEIEFKPVGKWLQISVYSPAKDYFVAIFEDITKRKQIEKELHKNQRELASALELAQIVNWEYDVATGMFTFDDRFFAFYGTTAEREGGHQISAEAYAREFVYPADIPPVVEVIQKLLATTDPNYSGQMEHRIVRRDGSVRTIIARYAPIMGKDGKVVRTHGANQDITERKDMEDALRESRQLFSDIISFLPDPTFVIDRDGKVLAWNQAMEKLSGVPAEDIVGRGDHEYSLWMYGKRRAILIDLVLHPDQDSGRINFIGIRTEGPTVNAQTDLALPSGRNVTLSIVTSPLFDAGGRIVGAIESLRDITHIKQTEAELARLNTNLETIVRERTQALRDEVNQRIRAEQDVKAALDYTRSIIQANPDLMVVLDAEGMVIDVNATGVQLTGIPREKMIGTNYFRYLVDDGTHADAFARLLQTGKLENQIRVIRSDGHITPMSVNATVIPGRDGTRDQIIVSAHDITRQQQDEAAIRASLEEKVILLREIHHRVKNNLQIIISLTNLQMRKTHDPLVKQIVAETQNRVRAMSLVHEKLYRSESLSQIDFADYTRYLATQLFSYYMSDTRSVKLDFSLGKIMVDINTAVPLGLIMNELVSNALKHGFPDGRDGTISVSGGLDGDIITLEVGDDGVGIPAELDWKNTDSLGMRLITSLVDQIGGTLELRPGSGTHFVITVRKKPEEEVPS
jgi:PAS domain S-box-containing protein